MANIYVRSGAAGAANGTTWADAFVTLVAALPATNADTVWVAHDHAETAGANKAHTFPNARGLRVLCGNTAAEPPTALAATATVTTTGNFAVTFTQGSAYIYGIQFNSGTGNSAASDILIASNGATARGMVFDTCDFNSLSTNAAAHIQLGPNFGSSTFPPGRLEFKNCRFQFGATGQKLLTGALIDIEMYGISLFGSVAPVTLFESANTNANSMMALLRIVASDLSGLAFTNLMSGAVAATLHVDIRNTKLPASIAPITGAFSANGLAFRMHNCDSGDTNYRMHEECYEGSVVSETGVYLTAGASDGTTNISHKMVSRAASTSFWRPLAGPEMVIWNNTIGEAKTVTVEIVHDSATALNDDEVWLEIEYLGTTGFPKGTIGVDRAANVLATPAAQTTSTEAWTGIGGFGTQQKQKLAVTFTPQEKGYVHARVMLALASKTLYYDPKLTVA